MPVLFAPGEAADRRFMAAAIRLSRKHLGLTGTNPSVGTLIVRDEGAGPVIVGSGVTALGGRPHAEPQALEEAGGKARGATAYVTLEPCAHHGRTPPCANALVDAGIARVVIAASDPDPRVSGKGAAILRAAGLQVTEGVLAREAADLMAGYLMRSSSMRPEVTLKLAVSADGMIGLEGRGQIAITGEISRAQVHALRAGTDAILVGAGTAAADDPELTCRLPGMEDRSPIRIVLDKGLRTPVSSRLARSARTVPVWIAAAADANAQRRAALADCGVDFLAVDLMNGRICLPELMEDLAARGISTLFVEGGAVTARRFLDEDLVDRICIFESRMRIGMGGVRAPLTPATVPPAFDLHRQAQFGQDTYREWTRAR
ncbi:MAG: bifunctional diaminohydroxyphosphoribosylaminopyrimidine deaminase/5-amino-6-(5-phosphoribosylamino)uracil reductase RibD [Zhengella sp.]|uniref:bifunctional diaminohydroxyphosphoribosylaminopyrimidine deaminase/5-amino-6-(5-phosphoribosylamino)uracil reductase RibD n=1 Tax=Zhengella sp. TaxID=2282762 RepID=UPI0035296A37|nr:bifunctional diaminohydroxyphosphoribosylaminopyrimidine deaminase/5-amino-6-(5-phosphoribosylamino)uracil reductase RibD [Brucellaceae bacterium]